MHQVGSISLRGVRVHNLRSIDLDLPHRRLIVVCGVSGSGKSSLAFDTLYAEGQRRYIESFSAYTRQFLQRLDKVDADRIEGIPPAVAVGHAKTARSGRSTVGTSTEINDYLRLLLSKIGRLFCHKCQREVHRHSPQDIADELGALGEGRRLMVTFTTPIDDQVDGPKSPKDGARRSDDRRSGVAAEDARAMVAGLRADGFVRVIVAGHTLRLDDESVAAALQQAAAVGEVVRVVVDRLTVGSSDDDRLFESVEAALAKGRQMCQVLVQTDDQRETRDGETIVCDGRPWAVHTFRTALECDNCGASYPTPEPKLFSFNSPLGACPKCEGFGNTIDLDMDLVVPDAKKTLRQGAIAPWNTPAYEHELRELIDLAGDYNVRLDVSYEELNDDERRLITGGVPEREFGGLDGFFAWLDRRKYKMHIRVFASRWRSRRTCEACGGGRLRQDALATRIGDKNIVEISSMKIGDARAFLERLELTPWQRSVGGMMLEQVTARLSYLEAVGVGYLALDRAMNSLSGGEAQRVAMAGALGSSLVNTLYVFDEPSAGLHATDTERLIGALLRLRDRGNTVVVVEHSEATLRAADQIVEIGPGAGQHGGLVTFQGTPDEIIHCEKSTTGDYLAGRREIRVPERRRTPNHGWMRISGATGNNLQDVTVEIPLGLFCVVTGVSGSGKSTLVEETLYPALCRRLRKDGPRPAPHDDVIGDGQINDVMLVDQSPIGRSPRSNPVTYIKAFDEIRRVFAETLESRTRNFSAGHFSFNVDGGRCPRCKGDGSLKIDMQFLADAFVCCPECRGSRYRREILAVRYRDRNIAEVLDMTVREAFGFFRGCRKVQETLKRLIDVGLEYLRLGQPANTLSGGEAQRLKLASHVTAKSRGRTLFILDEPSTGLHLADMLPLLDCFDQLLAAGHSLLVVEHNLHLIKVADYVIDLGPGAAEDGGRVVAEGTPEEVAHAEESVTGRYLRALLPTVLES
jgi:excinuclease ABC subunit A